jgi:hypothetical protein
MQTIIIKIEVSDAESQEELKRRVDDMLESSELYEYLNYPSHEITIEQ